MSGIQAEAILISRRKGSPGAATIILVWGRRPVGNYTFKGTPAAECQSSSDHMSDSGMAGGQIGRYTFEPGWRWSECIKPVVSMDRCQVEHIGYVVSGMLHVEHDDGRRATRGICAERSFCPNRAGVGRFSLSVRGRTGGARQTRERFSSSQEADGLGHLVHHVLPDLVFRNRGPGEPGGKKFKGATVVVDDHAVKTAPLIEQTLAGGL